MLSLYNYTSTKLINILAAATLTFSLGFVFSCKKSSDIQPGPSAIPPAIITKPVTIINSTSVVSGGEFTNTTTIRDKGIIWGNDSSTLAVSTVNKISNGAIMSSYTDTIQNLQPNTTYYLKAYAIYSSGVSYGTVAKFITPRTVYVAGYHGSSAAYWKDGKLFPLTGGTYAHSIFVAGSDVYVAGENNNGNLHAVYWKNGVPVVLTNGTNAASANSIYVVGNDVYVGGYELYNNNANIPVAKYWKNGVAVSLTNGTNNISGLVNSIYVAGTDVYAAGFTANPLLGNQIATYWKNGIAVPLNDSTNSIAAAQSIFVKGNDVYVAGNEKNQLGIGGTPVAKYWKNGASVVLTDGSQHAGAYSIFVTDSDMYVAGYEYNGSTGHSAAKYWKNGIPVSLTDGTKYGNAYSIYVADGEVYVAGGEGDYFNAECWKNGALLPMEISAQYSRSVSIFVQ